MIISGRFMWNAHKKTKKWQVGDAQAMAETWPQLMASKDYRTYMTGKWHVAAPADSLFTMAKHIRPGMPGDTRKAMYERIDEWKAVSGDMKDWHTYMTPGYGRPLNPTDTLWSSTDTLQGGFWEGGTHWSEVVRNDALSFIDDAKKYDNPFFMYLAFNAPHDPRQAPKAFLDQYPLENIALPKNYLPEYPFKDDMGNHPSVRDEALAPFPRTPYAVKKHRQEYYAIITHLDEQIGIILDAIQASGQMENTYIIFAADHGLSVGQHGLMGKQNMFDHSIRVPLIVKGPDIPKNKRIDTDVYLQDVMATSLELAGVEKPAYVQFNSFLDVLKGTDRPKYESIYGAYESSQRMLRKDGHKLIVYPKIEKVLLFDLKDDPLEMNNIADVPEQRKRVATMFKALVKLQEQMADTVSLRPMYDKLFLEAL